ncbi:RNA polymerase sigma factor [Sphingobacterium mizutaii NBRC 14946 = DSM 11724]|uniref:RNA polymerase sigma factor sigV n=2 Tax=Sphingobacterium mizutaii TaxID=1010 RepID=A0AAJ4X8G5_9SPHI|nr:RNA polymerase sigma factor [Sphingobacterium mizutaii]GEM68010.1 RNA polymerase sigma factor [Sphingobacterium mizutaii NBRC 14946 = DSM 11724]SDL78547.1 RNA polymerase sigma-70 factor, ECF subfamily [Sphingobacterium mizutaii]SNV37701.1 RNA polymerase sigma factor sigV [Sphingobacterium mizutaii]
MNNDFIKNEVLVHSDTLLHYANKFTKDQNEAEDLLQDTLMKVIRYQEKFEESTNLLGWIYTIMKNIFINRCRKNRVERNYASTVLPASDPSKQQSQNKSIDNFLGQDIDSVLISIHEKYYLPFIMFFEGYKYYEIAEHLGIPEGTVKTRIHTARKLLQEKLKSYRFS